MSLVCSFWSTLWNRRVCRVNTEQLIGMILHGMRDVRCHDNTFCTVPFYLPRAKAAVQNIFYS